MTFSFYSVLGPKCYTNYILMILFISFFDTVIVIHFDVRTQLFAHIFYFGTI